MNIDQGIEQELKRVTALSDSVPKFGSVITRGESILCSGFAHKATSEASVRDNPLLLIHAEESALSDALRKSTDIAGADIYVLGIRESGEIRFSDYSYSCVVCSRLLKQSGLSHVVYPTPSGWERVSVEEMFLQAIKRVQDGKV